MSSLYFSKPLAWQVAEQRAYMEKAGQINFHKTALNEVMMRVDTVCSYLSHLTTKKEVTEEIEDEDGKKSMVDRVADRIYFLAHLIKNGEKKVVRFDTGKEFAHELVAEDYKALKHMINEYITG